MCGVIPWRPDGVLECDAMCGVIPWRPDGVLECDAMCGVIPWRRTAYGRAFTTYCGAMPAKWWVILSMVVLTMRTSASLVLNALWALAST
jgi:hypothetical protein